MDIRQNSIFLAPMAGVTDRAFRELAVSFGADRTYTEMVSSKGLYYNDKKTAQLLETSEKERPIAVQIFGHEPELMGEIAGKALAFGGDYLDLNFGCPANKIISNSDGGAVMKDISLLGRIVKKTVDASKVPVTVKIRKGWDDNSVNAVEAAKSAQENGAQMIAVHGRTVKQGYSGTADWDIIRQVAEEVDVPVIGNGDVFSAFDAKNMIEQTGCAGVMLGRGALGNPFIIKKIRQYLDEGILPQATSRQEKISTAKQHISLIIKYKGEYAGIREARKHAIWYVKGMPGSTKVKGLLTSAETYDEMCRLLDLLV